MDLRDRSGREGLDVEPLENRMDGIVVSRFENRYCLVCRERRYRVLELGEFFGDIRREQVAPGRDRLAEFDEDRAELFEREADALAQRRGRSAAPRKNIKEEAQWTQQVRFFDEFIETVFDEDPLNSDQAG